MKRRTSNLGLRLALLTVLGAAVFLHTHRAGAEPAGRPPQVMVVPWSDALLPPSFSPDDDPRSLRGLPPDSLDEASRPTFVVPYAAVEPSIDGDLTDWPLVRWYDLRGGATLVRGSWSGTSDAALDFAVLWTRKGLVLGARLVDDSLDVDVTSEVPAAQRVESVLLYVGSSSPVVQRYWRSAERAFRVWGDGRLEAWTRLQNRRPVLFDPALLGVQGAAQGVRRGPPGGALTFELFVPWDALFPALPHEEAGLLLNVLVEDVDAGREKLFAWATRPDPAPGTRAALKNTWARMLPEGGPDPDTWIASLGTSHLEAGIPCEWSLLHWGGTAGPAEIGVGEHGEKPLRCTVPATPVILRYEGDFGSSRPWPRDRRLELDIGLYRQEPWRHDVMHRIPTPASFDAGAREVGAAQPGERVFPRPADVEVRLKEIGRVAAALGDWRTVRYTDRGILATRAAAWASIEHRLLECQMLRDLMLGPPDDATSERLLDMRWPRRMATGIPVGTLVIRGMRSELDGSTQPYGLYVSQSASEGELAPLLLVLHDFDEDVRAPFDGTGLGEAVEERGWIAVSPFGRGNTGYALAGERDVLDVLEQVRQDLPVDGRRIYVLGAGMGGSGAWLLSLRHGALFAAAGVVSGYADMDQPGLFQVLGYRLEEVFFFETMNPSRLLRPGLETAYRVVHAERDQRVSVVHARVMKEKLEEYGLQNEVLLPETQQEARPLFVEQLAANLDFFAAHRRSRAGVSEPAWFRGRGGPVATVFPRGAFAVVAGTLSSSVAPVQAGSDSTGWREVTGKAADARTAEELALEWESLFSGVPPLLDDSRLDASLQESTNLVLVGEPRTHVLLQKIAAALPVHYDGDRFEVAGQSWSFAEAGILYATPNPVAPQRTLVVLSGMAERLGGLQKSLLKLGADYAVVNDAREILAIGHFEAPDDAALPDPPR